MLRSAIVMLLALAAALSAIGSAPSHAALAGKQTARATPGPKATPVPTTDTIVIPKGSVAAVLAEPIHNLGVSRSSWKQPSSALPWSRAPQPAGQGGIPFTPWIPLAALSILLALVLPGVHRPGRAWAT
jgi:hypothetical protein